MHKPYVPHTDSMIELTVRSVVLGCLISVVIAASNAYLGLFAGMTVSSSIPASIISVAILRHFKNNSILENNIVQTTGSSGSNLVSGIIFTFPALIMMGYWKEFHYWDTTIIAITGGVLGTLYTIPLRRALIITRKLKYPEGVATAEVLKVIDQGGSSIKTIIWSSIIGGVAKYASAGAGLWHGVFESATMIGGRAYAFFGMNLSPALLGVGYIVGIRIALLVFIGGVFSWYIAIPFLVAATGNPDNLDAVTLGYKLWSTKIRYIGVGAMISGGLWAIFDMRESIVMAFTEGFKAFREKTHTNPNTPRTELDMPMPWVIAGIVTMIVPVFFIYLREIHDIQITAVMAVIMIVAGFLFAAVAGYMAGLVGTSNNPISGITIATILFASIVLLAFLGSQSNVGPAAAILIGAVVCCGCGIAGDNMQDLKTGHVLGATPYKQQIGQLAGTVVAAFTIAPVLNLLNTAYGFGPKTAEHPQALAAPQATLMNSVTKGVFGGGLPWDMICIGLLIGIGIIAADQIQKRRGAGFRIPVLSVAIGIYLPLQLDTAILLGGCVAWLIERFQTANKSKVSDFISSQNSSERAGLMFASGLITGEALVGILLAIPIAITSNSNVLKLLDQPIGYWPGAIVILMLCLALKRIAEKAFLQKSS